MRVLFGLAAVLTVVLTVRSHFVQDVPAAELDVPVLLGPGDQDESANEAAAEPSPGVSLSFEPIPVPSVASAANGFVPSRRSSEEKRALVIPPEWPAASGNGVAAQPVSSTEVRTDRPVELLTAIPDPRRSSRGYRLAQKYDSEFHLQPVEPQEDDSLLPLELELAMHGGAHLYEPEGEQAYFGAYEGAECTTKLRLPENFQGPEPITCFQKFLGSDPIYDRELEWFGMPGFQWEPRFVAYGSYELFAIAYEQAHRRRDGVGHQMLLDLDLRLTGTERFHVQFRPIGEKNSGGSIYRFNNPTGYDDNSTGIPDRYWFEGEFNSIFGQLFDEEFTPRDYHFVIGKYPISLHNNLLINDDILGFGINKNSILVAPLSNLNLQFFYGLDDVDRPDDINSDLVGLHAVADYRHALIEASLAHLYGSSDSGRDASYAALSATQFVGAYTFAGRVLGRWNDDDGVGDGQLFVLESNLHRTYHNALACATGVESGVYYLNLFKATTGWQPISNANFDRLRSTFEINPLVQISAGNQRGDAVGVATGVQLFRHHEDESFIPEFAYEEVDGSPVWGASLRWQRKVGVRSFVDVRGVRAWSTTESFKREGVFASLFWLL